MPTNAASPGLLALGWDGEWAAALAALNDPTAVPARVSRVDRGMCTVMTGTADVRVATQRSMDVAVGDWLGIVPGSATRGGTRIVAVLPRRCVFSRQATATGAPPQVVAANIDTVLVCDALDGPLGPRHLERFLALAWQSGATPIVVMTKSDAVPAAEAADTVRAARAVAAEARVLVVSSATGEGIGDVAPLLVPGRTVALLGLSGAGKSTLVNLLAGAQILATGAVRKDGSGRHTTTHRELVLLGGGGIVIDTPGMRALSVLGAGDGVEQAFSDIELLARGCRYSDCTHAGEHGCALAAALADGRLERGRMESWQRLTAEPASTELADARRDVAARKRRKAAKVADRRAART